MTLFHKIDSWVTSNNRHITIYASFLSYLSFDHFVDLCRELNVKVKDIEINKSNDSYEDGIFAIVNLESQKRTNHMELIKKLSSLDGLKHIEEM
jgi:uncharacterized membrane protein YhiD involved in acid resistance